MSSSPEVTRALVAVDATRRDHAEPLFGDTPLLCAVESTTEAGAECVRILVAARGVDINHNVAANLPPNKTAADVSPCFTPILSAAYHGNAQSVEALATAPGIQVNLAPGAHAKTALHVACEHNQDARAAACVRALLLAPGLDANLLDAGDYTALMHAMSESKVQCVRALVASGRCDLSHIAGGDCGWEHMTMLMAAADMGEPEMLRALLAEEADVNQFAGWAGADGEGGEDYRRAALHVAATGSRESVACVRALLAAPGIDVNRRAGRGYERKTALDQACERGYAANVRALLAADGIDTAKACRDDDRSTALHLAAAGGRSGHAQCVEAFVERPGADVCLNPLNRWGQTPLACVCKMSSQSRWRTKSFHLLMAADAVSVNAADRSGRTPLYFAAANGRQDQVDALLLREEIDVHSASSRESTAGCTALHKASANGHVGVVRALLLRGACRLRLSGDGDSPLDVAKNAAVREVFSSGVDYWQRKHHAGHARALQDLVLTVALAQQRFKNTVCAHGSARLCTRSKTLPASRRWRQPPPCAECSSCQLIIVRACRSACRDVLSLYNHRIRACACVSAGICPLFFQ